ncbi:MAG: terminase small subunit [Oscillospiraceae bacterium]|nr:terminase small subunit [Oscillospiraceae bacterium]
MALTPRQRAFADYYIETGNATEAARRAGYKDGPTINRTASENLSKPDVAAYISERMQAQTAAGVADANEVIRFYSAVMRGEVKDQFGLDASLTDRLKAADSLMKRWAAADDRNRVTMEKLDKLFEEFRHAVDAEAD